MSKRNKAVKEVVVPVVAEVAPAVSEVPAAPAKGVTATYALGEKPKDLRAGYVQAAWSATKAILPATYAQIAALPEFDPAGLKGGKVSGYLAYWVKTGRLVEVK